jgi:arylsulfatase A
MATTGRRFTQCHSSPLCSPSRFALLTGKYNFRNYFDWGHMDRSQRTIANMFRDAGYKTYASGKWQLGGGDTSLHTFGFDNYCVWNATDYAHDKGSRYKNPKIYQFGNFLAPELTLNKYGEDIFCDSVLNFINNHKGDPFFIYYAMVNTHDPFSPTPDDPEFTTWDPNNASNPSFYPSMVKYADKKIGAVINKVNALGLAGNTVIIYVGDNGTGTKITSVFNGQPYRGGKAQTNENGTHVPCIIWGADIAPGVDTSLLCFQDFFPTLADIANISSSGYGILDGISFYPQLIGLKGTPRSWIYNYYMPLEDNPPDSTLTEWVQDYTYKLDLVDSVYTFRYVNTNAQVTAPTPEQKAIRRSFKSIMASMH